MLLNTLAFHVKYHIQNTICFVLAKVFATDSIDIEALLSGEGAAGEGGSLSGVNTFITDMGQGGYTVTSKAGLFIAAISVLAFFIMMAVNANNPMKRQENKGAIPTLAFAVVGIFAVGGLLMFAQGIGSNIFQP